MTVAVEGRLVVCSYRSNILTRMELRSDFFMQALTDMRILVWLRTINTFLILLFGTSAQQTLRLATRQHTDRIRQPFREACDIEPVNLQCSAVISIIRLSVFFTAPLSFCFFFWLCAGAVGDAENLAVPSGTQYTVCYRSVPDLMSAVVTDALLKWNISSSNDPGICPTGHCRWENYQSMGVCSDVVDVSATITFKCPKTARQYYPGSTTSSPFSHLPALHQ